ncbi:MAG: hypothetical protein P1V36_10660, partial [Planctomycetota bacterium]|nr:hypothetical protein [Planctomycetota bacterium]
MARLRFLSILLVFACAVTPLWAEDEDPAPRPPPPPEQVLLATVEGDPEGGATQLATDIAVALGDDDLDLALTHLLTLAAEYPDALLPLKLLGARRNGRADGALQWPARRAVNRAIARLPAAQRARAAEAWAARMAALTTRVARGDEDALRILAEDHGVTPAGSRALLALADRAMEAGHHTRAARRYEAWLELNLEAEPAARAAVAVRLADALVTLQDAGGLQALGLLQHELRDIPVPGATGTTTL